MYQVEKLEEEQAKQEEEAQQLDGEEVWWEEPFNWSLNDFNKIKGQIVFCHVDFRSVAFSPL